MPPGSAGGDTSEKVSALVRTLHALGYKLYATEGTAEVISALGMPVEEVTKRLNEGHPNVLDVINGSGELMKELDRRLRVMDQVIRHMVVRVDEEKKVVERTQTKRRSESERRRVKRGLPPQRQPGEGRPAGDLDEGDDDRFDGVEV